MSLTKQTVYCMLDSGVFSYFLVYINIVQYMKKKQYPLWHISI